MEESKKEFMLSMISNRLFDKYKIKYSVLELMSMYESGIPDNVISKIEECKEYFSDLEDYVEIVDSISNPTGIYKYVRSYSFEIGTHYFYDYKNDKTKKNCIKAENEQHYKELSNNRSLAYSHFEENNKNHYTGVIIDHFSLLNTEAGAESLHKSMTRMSADYGRKMITKHWNMFFVNVQQQSSESEKSEFTKMGSKIEEKFKPTLADLADNKTTQRDALVAFGLFSPKRYNIDNYESYDIKKLNDNFRSLIVLKNRLGAGYIESPLFFNGAINKFQELPFPMKEEYYEQILESLNN